MSDNNDDDNDDDDNDDSGDTKMRNDDDDYDVMMTMSLCPLKLLFYPFSPSFSTIDIICHGNRERQSHHQTVNSN